MLPTQRVRSAWDDPFNVARNFDRALGRMLREDWQDEAELTGSYPVDINEDENNIYVQAEVPGFKRDELDITFESGVLTITGERKVEANGKQQRHLNERRYTRVRRSFSLPTTVDESNVNAKLENGVLHLTLPKREEVKPRRIEIK